MAAEVTVVGVGCEIDRIFAGQRPVLPLPIAPGREDLRDVFDAVGGPLRGADSVIIIAGEWLGPEAIDRLSLVRALLQTGRVAIHLTGLPPLAASVLAAVTAALAEHAASAGALAGAIADVAEQLAVLAWTPSVAGLDHPEVSLADHARSALPWSAFAVGYAPEVFVQPLSRGEVILDLPALVEESSLLIAPGERAEESDITAALETIAAPLGAVQVRQLEPMMHAAAWWGSTRTIEIVGVPVRLSRLAELTLPREVTPCRWCGELIAAPPCPLCGESGGRRNGRTGAVAPQGSPRGRGRNLHSQPSTMTSGRST